MNRHGSSSPWADALRGGVAGAVATALMDLVTTGLSEGQSKETTQREAAASPNGKSSVANLVDRLERSSGLALDPDQRAIAERAIHYGLGVVPGALYGAFRGRVPLLGAWRGLLYGAILWALSDEYLNAKLGLAGPFEAYPLETHLRGLVGHLVLGAVTDTGVDVLGGGR